MVVPNEHICLSHRSCQSTFLKQEVFWHKFITFSPPNRIMPFWLHVNVFRFHDSWNTNFLFFRVQAEFPCSGHRAGEEYMYITHAIFTCLTLCIKKMKQSKIANNLNLTKHISSREEINVKSWWNLVRSLTYKVLCVADSEWRPRTWLRVVIRVSLAVRSSFGNGSKWLIFIHCRAVWLKRCSLTEKIHKARIALD